MAPRRPTVTHSLTHSPSLTHCHSLSVTLCDHRRPKSIVVPSSFVVRRSSFVVRRLSFVVRRSSSPTHPDVRSFDRSTFVRWLKSPSLCRGVVGFCRCVVGFLSLCCCCCHCVALVVSLCRCCVAVAVVVLLSLCRCCVVVLLCRFFVVSQSWLCVVVWLCGYVVVWLARVEDTLGLGRSSSLC